MDEFRTTLTFDAPSLVFYLTLDRRCALRIGPFLLPGVAWVSWSVVQSNGDCSSFSAVSKLNYQDPTARLDLADR